MQVGHWRKKIRTMMTSLSGDNKTVLCESRSHWLVVVDSRKWVGGGCGVNRREWLCFGENICIGLLKLTLT